jgi:hypothetical protein
VRGHGGRPGLPYTGAPNFLPGRGGGWWRWLICPAAAAAARVRGGDNKRRGRRTLGWIGFRVELKPTSPT